MKRMHAELPIELDEQIARRRRTWSSIWLPAGIKDNIVTEGLAHDLREPISEQL